MKHSKDVVVHIQAPLPWMASCCKCFMAPKTGISECISTTHPERKAKGHCSCSHHIHQLLLCLVWVVVHHQSCKHRVRGFMYWAVDFSVPRGLYVDGTVVTWNQPSSASEGARERPQRGITHVCVARAQG